MVGAGILLRSVGAGILLSQLLHPLCGAARPGSRPLDNERLIGWHGESYTGQGDSPAGPSTSGHDASSVPVAANSSNIEPSMEALSWSPRIFHYKAFLRPEECDDIVKAAAKRGVAQGGAFCLPRVAAQPVA